jgi:hypothetical protein
VHLLLSLEVRCNKESFKRNVRYDISLVPEWFKPENTVILHTSGNFLLNSNWKDRTR